MFESRAGYAHAIAGQPVTVGRTPSPTQRNASVTSITARAMPMTAGVSVERSNSIPTDEDVILVTVRLSNTDRRASYDECLPERPRKRSFIKRVSTRILPPPETDKYKAVRMPRGDYKRHFARDAAGNYAGTEPQREWDEESINREYGMYQKVPIASFLTSPANQIPTAFNLGPLSM